MQNNSYIKAVIVEDERKIAENIKNKIETLDAEFKVTALAENGQMALESIEINMPQVVFTDISMPVMNGLELARRIQERFPNVVVVIISGYSDFEYAQSAIRHGVFNYLLKPIEDEMLRETLADIKKQLSVHHLKQSRQVLYSENYTINRSMDKRYALIVLCMGNTVYDVQDEEVRNYYQKKLEHIRWNDIMKKFFDGKFEWYLADEEAVNQKVLALQFEKNLSPEILEIADELRHELSLSCDLPVHVAVSEEIITLEEIWEHTKMLRYLLKQNLIVGQGKIIRAQDINTGHTEIIEMVKTKLSAYISSYFSSRNLSNFTEEIQSVIKFMLQNNATQQSIEKVCLYVIRLLEFTKRDYDVQLLNDISVQLQRNICISVSAEELMSHLLETFERINTYMESLYEDNVEKKIIEYVNQNYITLESQDQVADYFGYNYAYLSRLFKRKAGVTMNKYITDKKVEFAKSLIVENEKLSFKEIASMCGYADAKYFSRVFKNETGYTPSEYRSEHCDS